MQYLGDFLEDETVHFIWSSNDSSGASITRATNGTVSVYKDNGLTQSTAGITDTEDFDSLTGIHACTIDLSADAFYATGANYTVVLSGATIDGQSVNATLAHFSIENRFAEVTVTSMAASVLNAAAIATDAITATKIASGAIDADAIAADAITAAKIAPAAMVKGDQVTGFNDLSTAQVNTEVDTALADYDAPTKAELDAAHSTTDGLITTVDTVVDGIQADLDNGIDGLGAIKSDTAAILVDTADMQPKLGTPAGVSISADIATIDTVADSIEVDTQDIQSRLPAALVGGKMDSDTTAISGDTGAADNLELQYDGTGLTGDEFPSSQGQVGAIGAASGGSLNFEADGDNTGGAIKGVSFVGSQTGTYSNTEAEDGILHTIDDTANAIDIIYSFSIGGNRTASQITFKGYLGGSNDQLNIQAYDFIGMDWETRTILNGKAGTVNDTIVIPMLSKHTGTGAESGTVYIRFQGTAQSNPQLNVDELLASGVVLSQSIGYADGAIWVDTNNGTAGTESFVNGTADNPVDTWADALSLSSALSITRFIFINGSSITLTGAVDNYTLKGEGWTLALGGQSIVGAHFHGATVSGIGAGVGTTQTFTQCLMGAVTVPKGTHILESAITDTFTAGEAGDLFWDRCHSGVAGTSTPIFDFGGLIGNTNLNVRNYSGGIQLENMGDTGVDTASIEGRGQVIEGTCTGGTVTIRGNFTISGITNITLSDDARIDVAQINAEVDTAITDAALATAANLATVDTVVDGIQADLDNGTDGLGAIKADTAAILADTADMQPKLGTPAGASISADVATIDSNVDAILVDTNELQTDWVDGGRLDALLDTAAGYTVPTAATIADAVWDENLDPDHQIAGSAGKALDDAGAGASTPAAIADAVWDEASADHVSATSMGYSLQNANVASLGGSTNAVNRLKSSTEQILECTIDGGSFTPTATQMVVDDINGSAPSSVNDFYNDALVVFTSGALAGQRAVVSDYVGSSKKFTITALTSAPSDNDTFILV